MNYAGNVNDSSSSPGNVTQPDGTGVPVDGGETWPTVVPVDVSDIQPSTRPTFIVVPRSGGMHMEASYKPRTKWGKRFFRASYGLFVLIFIIGVIGCLWLSGHGRGGQAMAVFAAVFLLAALDFILMLFVAPKLDDKYRRLHHDGKDEQDRSA